MSLQYANEMLLFPLFVNRNGELLDLRIEGHGLVQPIRLTVDMLEQQNNEYIIGEKVRLA